MRTRTYALLTDTSLRICLTVVTVQNLWCGRREVAWAVTIDANSLPANEFAAMLKGAFEFNSRALQHFLAATVPRQTEDDFSPAV